MNTYTLNLEFTTEVALNGWIADHVKNSIYNGEHVNAINTRVEYACGQWKNPSKITLVSIETWPNKKS